MFQKAIKGKEVLGEYSISHVRNEQETGYECLKSIGFVQVEK